MKVQTYLPVFSGFYNSFWDAENEIENEIENINEQREELGLPPIKYDDCDFDFSGYYERISKGITDYIEKELIDLGLVKSVTFEKLSSPREYNFYNDSINVTMELTKKNEKAILARLQENAADFETWIAGRYTSRSGFISHYPNTVEEFMEDNPLEHEHKLGAILDFLLGLEIEEIDIYYNVQSHLDCINYEELTTKIEETNAN